MIASTKDQETAKEQLQDLLDDATDRMTPWEVEFIDGLDRRFLRFGRLFTEGQCRVLNSVWERLNV